jgi:hypothetical protein
MGPPAGLGAGWCSCCLPQRSDGRRDAVTRGAAVASINNVGVLGGTAAGGRPLKFSSHGGEGGRGLHFPFC